MKIVYAGTPDFALAPLQALIDNHFEVVGVITQEDKPQGRKAILTPPPVKLLAQKYGIPVIQPKKIRDEIDAVKGLGGDVMITCAYGQILTQAVLDCFEKGVWNIHAGLLPKYRGASPIQACILNGESETGVSIMKTELGLDCGDVLCVEKTPVHETETCGQLSARLSQIGANLLLTALRSLQSGEYTLTPQCEEGVCVVRKIHKEQAKINFTDTCKDIVNLVRAMNPAPVAYTACGALKLNVYEVEQALLNDEEQALLATAVCGEILSDKVRRGLLVKCGDGAVKLVKVQPSGGKQMSGGDLLNGRKVQKGQVLYAE